MMPTATMGSPLRMLGPGAVLALILGLGAVPSAYAQDSAELVISVSCLGNTLEETVTLLRGLDDHQPHSKEFDRPGAMGFGTQVRPPRRPVRDEDIPF